MLPDRAQEAETVSLLTVYHSRLMTALNRDCPLPLALAQSAPGFSFCPFTLGWRELNMSYYHLLRLNYTLLPLVRFKFRISILRRPSHPLNSSQFYLTWISVFNNIWKFFKGGCSLFTGVNKGGCSSWIHESVQHWHWLECPLQNSYGNVIAIII